MRGGKKGAAGCADRGTLGDAALTLTLSRRERGPPSRPCGARRGMTSRSRLSVRPAFHRSTAMAPITALSVQSCGGATWKLSCAGRPLGQSCRRRTLAATPPPTQRIRKPVRFIAANALSTNSQPQPLESWRPDRRSIAGARSRREKSDFPGPTIVYRTAVFRPLKLKSSGRVAEERGRGKA